LERAIDYMRVIARANVGWDWKNAIMGAPPSGAQGHQIR
jgi:hypothetical protein